VGRDLPELNCLSPTVALPLNPLLLPVVAPERNHDEHH
jgi:hypothetical protein